MEKLANLRYIDPFEKYYMERGTITKRVIRNEDITKSSHCVRKKEVF